jgi:DNA-binding NtrC family response regulator
VEAAGRVQELARPAVLVVDDERGPRESLRLILQPHFAVYCAEAGEEALSLFRRHWIDVVTLDLKMPGMSGVRVMSRMKELDPDVEVVIVTGYGSLDSALEVLRLRAFDYVSKPFTPSAILDVARRATESRRAHARARAAANAVRPLGEIVRDVGRWQDQVQGRLADVDRRAVDDILRRLQALRRDLELGVTEMRQSKRAR